MVDRFMVRHVAGLMIDRLMVDRLVVWLDVWVMSVENLVVRIIM